MPDRSTVFRWLEADEEFRDQYARARRAQAHAYADDIIEIADTVKAGGRGKQVEKARLQIDARKWTAAKLLPKVYGDRMEPVGEGAAEVAQALSALLQKLPG